MSETRKVFRNVTWNVLGLGLPLIVAVGAFPLLISGMGAERFGVLLLAWMIVGYFSIFDLGLGRAMIKLVAEKRGEEAYDELPGIIYTTLLFMGLLGVTSAVAFSLISPWLVNDVLKIPGYLRTESQEAFKYLAWSIPLVVISSGLSGVLEAHQRFGWVNMIRLPLGLATFLLPLMMLYFSPSLVGIVIALVLARATAALAYIGLCYYVVPAMRTRASVSPAVIPKLFRLGGWMTASNLISPLMVYLDRFVVGATLSMSAVTYYTTPYEVVTRALLLPRAIMGVLFPELSLTLAKDSSMATALFHRWRNYIVLMMFPFVLLVATLAHDLLSIWLGSEFADKSTRVLQLLAMGVFVNSLAQLAFGLIQSAGRPDFTAKLHSIELPFYLIGMWWLIGSFGIDGAALAWLLRVSVDALVLFHYSGKILTRDTAISSRYPLVLTILLLTVVVGMLLPNLAIRLSYLLIVISCFAPFAWNVLLHAEDRLYVRNRVVRTKQ